MKERTAPVTAVVLARHVGRDPSTLRIEREERAEHLRTAARVLTHLAQERSMPMVTDLPRGRVQARWSMSSGMRLQLAWGESEGPLGVSFAHLPSPVLDTFSHGTVLDRVEPWLTAGIVAERCATAAEAIVAVEECDALERGIRLQAALRGWIAHLEDATGLGRLRAYAASPWNPGMAWNGDVQPEIIDADALGLPEPRGRGVAILDHDRDTSMGSIVVHAADTDPIDRMRAMAAYREAIA